VTIQSIRLILVSTVLIIFAALSGCIERKAEQQSKQESPVSAELTSMLAEHQQMRQWGTIPAELINEADLRHRQSVYQLMAQSLIVEPGDLFKAAILLQDSGSSGCSENSMLAYYCALESARKGHEEARRLSAECLDMYLIASGLPQKYGTQMFLDVTGKYLLYPLDSSTTDADRASWNLPPLDSLKSLAVNKFKRS
jgi:hypothetical protein